MTQLDVLYRYGVQPASATVTALTRVREVYGIRQLHLDERARTVRIEYDATRLTEPAVHGLLRRTGLDIQERVSLITPPPALAPEAAPAA